MSSVSRRRFLGEALLAGAGATVLRPFAPGELAGPAADASEESDLDPNFVAGQVVDVSDGRIIVRNPDDELRELAVTSGSGIWKRAEWNGAAVTVDDCIYARGEADESGRLVVERLWANIAAFTGRVHDARRTSVTLEMPSGAHRTTAVIERTEVESRRGGFGRGSASHLRPGDVVQVVEFNEPGADDYTASRLLLMSGTQSATVVDDEDIVDIDFATNTCTYKGLTTWFCCGSVGGCGRCGNDGSSGGACGGCRSDSNHMAWPKIGTGCGPFCDNCCVPSNFPRLPCGRSVTVRNPCNSRSQSVRIRDCGPQIRCVSDTGCNNWNKVKFDLTPCAFSAIGNLDAGRINCRASTAC
ncbi:MAG: septal ring lytic transglycosylase RlpA family protein [Actinomycetota bacterium]|nr:septal ring lytic transglycosylase RlpA family protein [Actinomycetota bacterium]